MVGFTANVPRSAATANSGDEAVSGVDTFATPRTARVFSSATRYRPIDHPACVDRPYRDGRRLPFCTRRLPPALCGWRFPAKALAARCGPHLLSAASSTPARGDTPAAQPGTAIKLGCGCGPIASFHISVRRLCSANSAASVPGRHAAWRARRYSWCRPPRIGVAMTASVWGDDDRCR